MLTRSHLFQDPDRLLEFCEAGRAIITLESRRTGDHYTYKIKDGTHGFYVSRRSNGHEKWIYLGMIDEKGFRYTQKTSGEALHSKHYKVFQWFWTILTTKRAIHAELDVYHEGMCGACGQPLTTPESIVSGFGPTCLKRRKNPGWSRTTYDLRP